MLLFAVADGVESARLVGEYVPSQSDMTIPAVSRGSDLARVAPCMANASATCCVC